MNTAESIIHKHVTRINDRVHADRKASWDTLQYQTAEASQRARECAYLHWAIIAR